MTSLKAYAVIVLYFLLTISCKERPARPSGAPSPEQSAIELDPRLKNADSLVVVFYDDPFSADSLRYTRYYKQISATPDNNFFDQLNQKYTQQEKKACRGEGKIWCYNAGKIFQTLYFSTQCEECCFLYLIKDGNFHFSRTSPQFLNWLSSQKSRLIK